MCALSCPVRLCLLLFATDGLASLSLAAMFDQSLNSGTPYSVDARLLGTDEYYRNFKKAYHSGEGDFSEQDSGTIVAWKNATNRLSQVNQPSIAETSTNYLV